LIHANQSGFDEAGNKIPVGDFDYSAVDKVSDDEETTTRSSREITVRLLQMLSSGNARPDEIGRKVLILTYLVSPEGTQRQLADRLGLSESRLSSRLRELRLHLSDESIFN